MKKSTGHFKRYKKMIIKYIDDKKMIIRGRSHERIIDRSKIGFEPYRFKCGQLKMSRKCSEINPGHFLRDWIYLLLSMMFVYVCVYVVYESIRLSQADLLNNALDQSD